MTNWSSTHAAAPIRLYEPGSPQECVRVLQKFHDKKARIRPVGTALSPNGIGLASSNKECMISVSNLDSIVVDKDSMTCTVGAGITVSAVLAELKKHGLTLENFSSIQEQQMGGWTQVSAHGTGISLPPVDEMIVSMEIATPMGGLLTLSDNAGSDSIHPLVNRDLFRMCKVGLGSLGVVTELVLKCIPRMDLVEHTNIKTRKTISPGHKKRLGDFRHVRYMWIPYSDTVVQITTNPYPAGVQKAGIVNHNNNDPTKEMRDLLLSIKPDKYKGSKKVDSMSFSQLRDELLDIAPLDLDLVKKINRAEAVFWRGSAGCRIDDSTNILGFDCGGEQWVYEVCVPMGTLKQQPKGCCSPGKDIRFVQELLRVVEENGIAAPSPIEQRWTGRSTAPMSPAYSENPDDIFTWVGVIMYLPPSQTPKQRKQITDAFNEYTRKLAPLYEEYGAHAHWAKIEIPEEPAEAISAGTTPRLDMLRSRIAQRYNVEEFNSFRRALDPHRVLGNELVDNLFQTEKGENRPAISKKELLERRQREKDAKEAAAKETVEAK
jgi:L-galactono-1,4-lactone dehydrogenase